MSFHRPLFILNSNFVLLLSNLSFTALHPNLLELLRDLSQNSVDANIWPFMERLLAHGTLIQRGGLPVSQNAALAEVMSTGDRHGVGEDVQADGAVDLLL